MSPAAFIDDPKWADFIGDWKEPSKTRHLPAHTDCSRIDPEKAAEHLRYSGTLGAMEGYEERPGQIDMLKSICRAFNDREHLMVEAGTGVGKSLAYLVPAILWAWTNDTPVVISTATRNLQGQLLSSDIPRALAILGNGAKKFKVALLKGRGNYLCLRAVADFFSAGFWTMSSEEQEEMPRFIEWLKNTPDGDLDTYGGISHNLLSCPGEECGGRRCPWYSKCFVYRARKNAADAHLVVVNHSLALADATSSGGTLLPPHGRIIFDEAHNLEDVATEFLSMEFSLPALTRILNRLVRKGRGKHARQGGVLASLDRQMKSGRLDRFAEKIARLVSAAHSEMVRIVDAADEISDCAAHLFAPVKKADVIRFRVENGVRRYSVRGLFKDYEPEVWSEARLAESEAKLEERLASMVKILHDIRDILANASDDDETNPFGETITQLNAVAESLIEFANETHAVLGGEKEDRAYWAEKVRLEKRRPFMRIVSAPLSVAAALHKFIYDVKDSVILSSATLRVGGNFKYMSQRLGCCAAENPEDGRFRTFVASSPFDYLRQSLALAPDCLPDPSVDPDGYSHELSQVLSGVMGATDGRALVLFTSYEMMNNVAVLVRGALDAVGISLLVQGEGVSRELMTKELKSRPRTVLFGAQSFWEGVDIAGDALSCVVIARLPFAQIGDPIVEARGEKIDREGGSSFRDYLLPEAVIRFRQGFGRLIRTKRDKGVVVVTDPRIVTKNYGAIFRKSIPTSVHTVTSSSELISTIADFF